MLVYFRGKGTSFSLDEVWRKSTWRAFEEWQDNNRPCHPNEAYYSDEGDEAWSKYYDAESEYKKAMPVPKFKIVDDRVELISQREGLFLDDYDPEIKLSVDKTEAHGVFKLCREDSMTLRYTGTVTTSSLYPCKHPDYDGSCNGYLFQTKEPHTFTTKDIVSDVEEPVPVTTNTRLTDEPKPIQILENAGSSCKIFSHVVWFTSYGENLAKWRQSNNPEKINDLETIKYGDQINAILTKALNNGQLTVYRCPTFCIVPYSSYPPNFDDVIRWDDVKRVIESQITQKLPDEPIFMHWWENMSKSMMGESGGNIIGKPKKKLIQLKRETNEGLLLLYEMFKHYEIQYLDDLKPVKAWGRLISGEFKSELITNISDARKTITLSGGEKLTQSQFTDKYRRRFS
jgi:hypothetical protein